MFYILVGLWSLGCLSYFVIGKLQNKKLCIACPIVTICGCIGGVLLYINNQHVAAYIFVAVALYIWIVLRWNISKQRKNGLGS